MTATKKTPTKAPAKTTAKTTVEATSNRSVDLNLHQRIHLIMQDVKHLSKDGEIAFKQVKYKAVTEEKVTTEVRKSLIAHGVTCVPTGEIQWSQTGTLNTIIVNYLLTNIDNPEDFIIIPTIGQGADTQDKGTNKAMTGAFKYLLLRTFNIPTGDDPDDVSSNELDEKHAIELKKKYTKLLIDGKEHFTPEGYSAAKFNDAWDDAKIIAMTHRLQKYIEKAEQDAVIALDQDTKASQALAAADQAGQPTSIEI